MRLDKLKNSNLLKPGQLLVVSKYCKFYGDAALLHLWESAEIGPLHFYRHRQEPVPWINRVKHGRFFRHPRTTNERRAHFSNNATEEILESYGVALKLRQKRKSHMLPNAYNDVSLRYQRSWKEHRGTQRKNAAASTGDSTALRFGLGASATNTRAHGHPARREHSVHAEGQF
jgi:hypothetical protein